MVRLKRRRATSNGSFSLTRIEVIDPEVFALGVLLVASLVVRPGSQEGGSGIQPGAWTKMAGANIERDRGAGLPAKTAIIAIVPSRASGVSVAAFNGLQAVAAVGHGRGAGRGAGPGPLEVVA